MARDIIVRNPDHIAARDCCCRNTKEDPCEPRDVCIAVGEPFTSFIVEHGTNNARTISQEEAVGILQTEDNRGHVHTASFKEEMGNRFYAICNCCKCCCAAMRAYSFGLPLLASSGYVSSIGDDCNGCGDCVQYSQFGAIQVDNGLAVVTQEMCMGCGICESKCTQGAIKLRKDPAKGEPLDVTALS